MLSLTVDIIFVMCSMLHDFGNIRKQLYFLSQLNFLSSDFRHCYILNEQFECAELDSRTQGLVELILELKYKPSQTPLKYPDVLKSKLSLLS